jgi:hypothetical protein
MYSFLCYMRGRVPPYAFCGKIDYILDYYGKKIIKANTIEYLINKCFCI